MFNRKVKKLNSVKTHFDVQQKTNIMENKMRTGFNYSNKYIQIYKKFQRSINASSFVKN